MRGIITMLSRMWQCSSYDDVEAMDTSIANAIIAKSDIFGVVLPSNISTGVFVQVAGDKNDKNDDTLLGGMRTTQATTLTLFQRGQFGPHLNCRSRRTTQRGNTQLNRCICANLSDSAVLMESIQQLGYLFLRTDT